MAAKRLIVVDMKDTGDSISRGSIEVCRLMHPDDANIAGNVHGGTTLKLIEEAGFIIATRHCNKNGRKRGPEPILAALARVERTDFLQPMFIGEVAQVHVELGYASTHSLEVQACVWAENLITGSRRLTNRASLWYVPVTGNEEMRIIPEVPAVEYSSKEEEERGKERYNRQKRARLDKRELMKEVDKRYYLCIGQIEDSTYSPRAFGTFAVPGRRKFYYQSLPGGGEFDPPALGVGNFNIAQNAYSSFSLSRNKHGTKKYI